MNYYRVNVDPTISCIHCWLNQQESSVLYATSWKSFMALGSCQQATFSTGQTLNNKWLVSWEKTNILTNIRFSSINHSEVYLIFSHISHTLFTQLFHTSLLATAWTWKMCSWVNAKYKRSLGGGGVQIYIKSVLGILIYGICTWVSKFLNK